MYIQYDRMYILCSVKCCSQGDVPLYTQDEAAAHDTSMRKVVQRCNQLEVAVSPTDFQTK